MCLTSVIMQIGNVAFKVSLDSFQGWQKSLGINVLSWDTAVMRMKELPFYGIILKGLREDYQ